MMEPAVGIWQGLFHHVWKFGLYRVRPPEIQGPDRRFWGAYSPEMGTTVVSSMVMISGSSKAMRFSSTSAMAT